MELETRRSGEARFVNRQNKSIDLAIVVGDSAAHSEETQIPDVFQLKNFLRLKKDIVKCFLHQAS